MAAIPLLRCAGVSNLAFDFLKTYTVAPNLEISFRDSGEQACAPAHVAVMDI